MMILELLILILIIEIKRINKNTIANSIICLNLLIYFEKITSIQVVFLKYIFVP